MLCRWWGWIHVFFSILPFSGKVQALRNCTILKYYVTFHRCNRLSHNGVPCDKNIWDPPRPASLSPSPTWAWWWCGGGLTSRLICCYSNGRRLFPCLHPSIPFEAFLYPQPLSFKLDNWRPPDAINWKHRRVLSVPLSSTLTSRSAAWMTNREPQTYLFLINIVLFSVALIRD